MIFPLLSSLLLCFVLSVEQFAIPAMVGIPGHVNTLATELYLLTSFLAAQHRPRCVGRPGDEARSPDLSIFPLQRQIVRRHSAPTVTGRGYRVRPLTLGGHGASRLNAICLFYVAMSFITFPLLALIYTSGIKFFVANPFRRRAWTVAQLPPDAGSVGTLRAFWEHAGGGGRRGRCWD